MENILIALITVAIPSITTLITTKSVQKQANKHSSRQSILQLIVEDKLSVEVEHKLPENKQAIMQEYDEYVKNGGNSYVHRKVDDYIKWYETINDQK